MTGKGNDPELKITRDEEVIKYSWIDLQKSDKDSYYDINVSPSDGKIQRK